MFCEFIGSNPGVALRSAECCVSYKNEPFVLQSKADDWFLYETQHSTEMGEVVHT